jgi:hypothetical protein
MPEIIVYSAFQAIVLLDMIPKKRKVSGKYQSDAIKASFDNGVLKVILPKVEPSKPSGRIIDID